MNVFRSLASLAGAAVAVTGCTGVDLLNGVTPRSGYSITRDIAYGEGPRAKLDLYVPTTDKAATDAPIVVFIHGGGWDSGSKDDYRFVGQAFTDRGYTVVVPGYRIYPEARYPDFVRDTAKAVAWSHRYRQEHGGADRPIFLMGHSAGAYNAVMVTVDPTWLGVEGLDPETVLSGTIGVAGPYDFLPLTSETLKIVFGPEDERPQTQPVNRIAGTLPPLLLLHGSTDDTVDPRNMESLARHAEAAGGSVETRLYDGIGHIRIMAAVSSLLRGQAPTFADTTDFIEARKTGADPS